MAATPGMKGVLLAMLLLASAGCASTATDPPSSTTAPLHPASTLPANATVGPPAPVATTDTLHLMPKGVANRTAPVGEDAVIATKAAASGPQTFLWNFTAQARTNVSGAQVRAWLRLTQTAAQSGGNNDPGCTLGLTVQVRRNGTTTAYAGGCGSAGLGALTPGDHLIEFAAPPGGVKATLQRGDNVLLYLTLSIETTGLGPTAFLIGGSPQHDTTIRLPGLREPVPRLPSS